MATNHQLYKDSSPYYQSILARYGRTLTLPYVEGVLVEHGLTMADLEGDFMPEGEALPDVIDAGDLLAWLGY